jgi:diguanylate cyclase (GGDEF)-like protein
MSDVTRRAARLLEEAQTGAAEPARATAEATLRLRTGDLVDGPAAMHFVRVVAFIVLGDLRAALAAVDLMLLAAERDDNVGWRACALATRASERLRLGESDIAEYDIEAALHDLAEAEVALAAGEPDSVAAVNARVGIAVGYRQLRLYELVGPQFQAAYEISTGDPEQNGNRSMWLGNLASLHLEWALELYQVGLGEEAEKHTAEAEAYALRSADEACGPDAGAWRESALLTAACARADRDDPAGAATDIEHYLGLLEARGLASAALAYSRPFHGVAVSRAGRPAEALRIMEAAVAALPADAEWLIVAATRRTHAVLLASHGSEDARAGLVYGDTLAAALWRERQRNLHAAGTMQAYEKLRVRHEQAAQAAETDALTGVANRRGFDQAFDALRTTAGGAGQPVAVLLVDLDKFKKINDVLGHAAGDAALRSVATALRSQLRDGDLVGRLGGDEFGVLLPGADPAAAAGIADRMVQAVRAIPDCGVTVSIGVAGGPSHALPETLRTADEAMYRVKRAGGDAAQSGGRPFAAAAPDLVVSARR